MAPNKSRTRRTRVPPNRSYESQPSSFMAGRRPSHFFKIILPSTIPDKKLRIPEKFVREFGHELSGVATLTVPYDHIWQVGLQKGNKEIWFHDGWQDFMESHCIHYGYFLVFRYEGNSKFHVLVFDNTATEIQYTWSKNCKLEDEVDIMELDDIKKTTHDHKLKENEMSDEEDRGTYVRERFSGRSSKGRLVMSKRTEGAIQAARMLKPKRPSFMGILRPYHARGHRCNLYVPSGFAKKYVIGHQFVELKNCDGKHWRVRCGDHRGNSSSAKNIGWAPFCRDNNLEEGDVCVFELLKRKPVVLNVSIFHSADYVSGVCPLVSMACKHGP